MELVKVVDDLFHIARRLKGIDRNYELFFNRKRGRFEIYAKGAMQIALPFDRLDARCLDYARKTRIENLSALMDEIEKTTALSTLKTRKLLVKNFCFNGGAFMIIKKVVGECLRRMGENDFTSSTQLTDEQKELQDKLIGACNIVYREIVSRYIPVYYSQKVTFEDGKTLLSSLHKNRFISSA